ncbi:MAG: hypothetical protein KDA32_02545 [Phycisphaerales bacterium]|nr:hypothetical protein [Phycisphaerales bacterium]
MKKPVLLAIWMCLAVLTPASLQAGDDRAVCGRVSTQDGITVLELWGTPAEAAYAHGWLMADKIVELVDGFMLHPDITPNPQMYDALLLPMVRRNFVWSEQQQAEIDALYRGAHDRLGERFRSERLDRALRVEDIMAANTMADWFGLFCSSFSVWGALSPDGATLTARNLDFPNTTVLQTEQVAFVRRGPTPRQSWVSIAWPGLIGVYTAMNGAGVTISMHDAPGLQLERLAGFTPRSLILREALESAEGEDFINDVQRVFESRNVAVGNNIHVSAADAPHAAIFEYDGRDKETKGVALRMASEAIDAMPAIRCTNHMCKRQPPVDCERYERLGDELKVAWDAHQPITVDRAFEMLASVRQRITLYSVVMRPAAREIWLLSPKINPKPVRLDVKAMLAGKGE